MDEEESAYTNTVLIQNIALKTYWKRWMIDKGGRRGLGISVLMVRHNDDDVYICIYIYIYISSSSSYRAGSTDIPDPLSPLLPIVHRPR